MAKVVNISEAASIAMHAMILIAKSDKQVNINVIAEQTKSSRHHAAKVMQRLAKIGYVSSQRGPKGGFILKKKAVEITLLEIFEAIEGEIEIENCPVGKESCIFDKCFLASVTNKMSREFQEYLKNNTIADYL